MARRTAETAKSPSRQERNGLEPSFLRQDRPLLRQDKPIDGAQGLRQVNPAAELGSLGDKSAKPQKKYMLWG